MTRRRPTPRHRKGCVVFPQAALYVTGHRAQRRSLHRAWRDIRGALRVAPVLTAPERAARAPGRALRGSTGTKPGGELVSPQSQPSCDSPAMTRRRPTPRHRKGCVVFPQAALYVTGHRAQRRSLHRAWRDIRGALRVAPVLTAPERAARAPGRALRGSTGTKPGGELVSLSEAAPQPASAFTEARSLRWSLTTV